MMNWLILVFFASALALAYAALNFYSVKRLDEGTDLMKSIASRIRMGAITFLNYEFRIIAIVAIVVAVLMGLVVGWYVAVVFHWRIHEFTGGSSSDCHLCECACFEYSEDHKETRQTRR